jgi:hypothetical protein
MTNDSVEQPIILPMAEAADLATKAAQQGVSTPEYLGMHVLRSAYGVMHPIVVAFEQRPKQGQVGTQPDEES